MAKGLKEARRSARQQRTSAVNQGRGQRWVDAKPFDLADEVRYMQRRAAERTGRIVTIGPLLRFSTDSGDAWILDPADHLATQIAEEGAARPVHIEETETSFAVGWQGAYDIRGTAFFLRHLESGRVMTSLGYPTRHIVERISSSQAPPAWCHSKRGSGLRRQFGREQPFTLRNAGTEPVFSDFDVGNPRSGSVYRMAIRGSQPGDNYCSCPDFATNALGTCKHVEFVLHTLEGRPRTRSMLQRGFQPPYSAALRRGSPGPATISAPRSRNA